MDREALGAFIGETRRERDMTQRDLAERLHVTDKAVSKWERGLSYPDVTLLEPLAAALGLGVEELVACRRQAEERGAEPMKNLLDISQETVCWERRRGRRRLAALAAIAVLAVLLAVWYAGNFVTQQRVDTIVLMENEGGTDYVYLAEGNHLLRLAYGGKTRLRPDLGRYYRFEVRWDRRTYEGRVLSAEWTGVTLPTRTKNVVVDYQLSEGLFGFSAPGIWFNRDATLPDPCGEGYLGSYSFQAWTEFTRTGKPLPRTILEVRDCRAFVPADVDGDGENELVVRTRWAEKPYTIYDRVDGKTVETWPETLAPEVEAALTEWWALREQP